MTKIEFKLMSVRAKESIGVAVTDMPTESEKSVTLNLYEILPDRSRIPYEAVIDEKTIRCAKELRTIHFGVTALTYTKNRVVIEALIKRNGTAEKVEKYLPLRE